MQPRQPTRQNRTFSNGVGDEASKSLTREMN